MKPWVLGDLVITDEWQGGLGTWLSILRNAKGITGPQGLLVERQGNFPILSGIRRSPVRKSLETFFLDAPETDRNILLAALAAIQSEEAPRRLIAVENILPGIGPKNLLMAFGPWDVRYDANDGWIVRDLFDAVNGILAAGWSTSPGNGMTFTGTSLMTFTNDDLADFGAVEIWYRPADDYTYGTDRYLLDAGDCVLYYAQATDKFAVYDGTTTVVSAVQTFSAAELIHLVGIYDATNGLALYVNNVKTNDTADAPAVDTTNYIGNASGGANPCKGEILSIRFYDTLTDDQVEYLYDAGADLADDPLGVARWVSVMPENSDPFSQGGKATLDLVTTLAIHGDQRWRSRDGDYAHWDVTATPSTKSLTIYGEDEAYPILYIKPNTLRTTGFRFERWVPIVWKTTAASYQGILLGTLDTATLIAASKMQSDGDDLRLYVDGSEADRWISGIDTATTKIWATLSFEAGLSVTITDSMGSGDTITELEVNEDITEWPSTGIILLGSEAFTYTSKDEALKTFLGVSRAARGTSAAAHTAGDTAWWIQHDIFIRYGDTALTAPTVPDTYKPMWDLSSSGNSSWVFAYFGDDDNPNRPGTWQFNSGGYCYYYSGDHGTWVSPWEELGNNCYPTGISAGFGDFRLDLAAGLITSANFQNGEKKHNTLPASTTAKIRSYNGSYTDHYSIPLPSTAGVWESWSYNLASVPANTTRVMLYQYSLAGAGQSWYEASDITVGVDFSSVFTVSIGAEQSIYSLDCTITNNTTGKVIGLTVSMRLNEILEVDTDRKRITNLTDGTNQRAGLTTIGGTRKAWLALVPGANTLQYEESGVQGISIDVVWDRRYVE